MSGVSSHCPSDSDDNLSVGGVEDKPIVLSKIVQLIDEDTRDSVVSVASVTSKDTTKGKTPKALLPTVSRSPTTTSPPLPEQRTTSGKRGPKVGSRAKKPRQPKQPKKVERVRVISKGGPCVQTLPLTCKLYLLLVGTCYVSSMTKGGVFALFVIVFDVRTNVV